MRIWSLLGGVWAVKDGVELTSKVARAIAGRPRFNIFLQPARGKNKFEIVAVNTTKRRAKIRKAWFELSTNMQVFPEEAWQDMDISIDAGDTAVVKVPSKQVRKQFEAVSSDCTIKYLGVLDDTGKVHKVRVSQGIKDSI
jgi:hypothetical protein